MNNILKKNHHYVPRILLKSWAHKNKQEIEIYTLNLKNNLIKKQPIHSVAKKKNLYTIPKKFANNSPKIIEDNLLGIWEERLPNVIKGIIDEKLTTEETRDLKGFVITQSFRTPKFERETKKIIEKLADKDDIEIPFQIHLFYLITTLFVEYLKNCTCEIFTNKDINNFICSDNPATHWNIINNEFKYISGISQKKELVLNPNYKIICPLTPKHLVILSPNIGIEIDKKNTEYPLYKSIEYNDIFKFNKMIEFGSDKMLFAKNLQDLHPIYPLDFIKLFNKISIS